MDLEVRKNGLFKNSVTQFSWYFFIMILINLLEGKGQIMGHLRGLFRGQIQEEPRDFYKY